MNLLEYLLILENFITGLQQCHSGNQLITVFKEKYFNVDKICCTIPFTYEIPKGTLSHRSVSIMHPFNQIKTVSFYQNYEHLIVHYCSNNKFSLRYPFRIASKPTKSSSSYKKIEFFIKNHPELQYYSKDNTEFRNYFLYKYSLFYKFFESNEIIQIDQKFNKLMILDIQKFFPSIYTHSITWVISKHFAKTYKTQKDAFFHNKFDQLMRDMNYGETHGIIVGSELSRIFAEMIMTDIDHSVYTKLIKESLILNEDYSIKRYVDDIYVYYNDYHIGEKIKSIYIEHLGFFGLHLNEAKTQILHSPFISPIAKAKHKIKRLFDLCSNDLDKLLHRIFAQSNDGQNKISIHAESQRIKLYFVKGYKTILNDYNLHHDVVHGMISDMIFINKQYTQFKLGDHISKLSTHQQCNDFSKYCNLILDIICFVIENHIRFSSITKLAIFIAEILFTLQKTIIKNASITSLLHLLYHDLSAHCRVKCDTYNLNIVGAC